MNGGLNFVVGKSLGHGIVVAAWPIELIVDTRFKPLIHYDLYFFIK